MEIRALRHPAQSGREHLGHRRGGTGAAPLVIVKDDLKNVPALGVLGLGLPMVRYPYYAGDVVPRTEGGVEIDRLSIERLTTDEEVAPECTWHGA